MSSPLACPECGYERKASDTGPLTQCQHCFLNFGQRKKRPLVQKQNPKAWLAIFAGLLGTYIGLASVGAVFYVAAKPIALFCLVLGGLPSMLFLLLKFLVPVFAFLGGLVAWRSLVLAILFGSPLLPLSAWVFSISSAGPNFMAVPVPWPTSVALGVAGSTRTMLEEAALTHWPVFVAGVAAGIAIRFLLQAGDTDASEA
jgi:hypothetical protein